MRFFTVIAVLTLAAVPAAAAGKASPSRAADAAVADVDISSDVIVWEPLVDFRQISLRVSGPSGIIERTFEPGETIYFDFVDNDGDRLRDGQYSFELVVSPVSEMVRDDTSAAGLETRNLKEAENYQSGSFTIEGGLAALPDLNEDSISFRTFVDTMDRVIQGSLCVGVDCPNSPSFGFDTVRLQENNLRIHFMDTSNSGSFPSNDWRLIANDSTNGGANKFALEDSDAGRQVVIVEAGSRSNAVYVDSNNAVGFGTSTPVGGVGLHYVSGNTPGLRLEQNGSSGFTAQTWDVSGNETNFFVRDVTNGSKLPFKIFPNAPNNSLTIEGTTGDVGVGTTSPIGPLHVVSSSDTFDAVVEDSGSNTTQIKLFNNTTGTTDSDGTNYAIVDSDVFFTNRENGDMQFFTNNQQKLLLDNTGNHVITGNLNVTGTLSKGAGAFKIDHPLDPENKYLSHSFVESPDMMNIYNGNVTLNSDGEAWVEMPEYFDALNRDFRYQLTAIGGPAPNLFIAEQISENRFKIGGGLPGATVSWQVTGIRHDPFANANRIKVEEDKPLSQRGHFLHPEVYNQNQRAAEPKAQPAGNSAAAAGSGHQD